MNPLSRKKAKEIIDLLLEKESPEHKDLLLNFLVKSEVEPNDPLFLALLNTGHLQFCFEKGLVEFQKTMVEISNLTKEIEAFQEQTKSDAIEVNSLLLKKLKAEHENFISNAIDSNNEAFEIIRESLDELKSIKSELKSERAEHIRIMKSLIDGMSKTVSDLEKASLRFENTINKQGFWIAAFHYIESKAKLFSQKSLIKLNIWTLVGGGLILSFSLTVTSYFFGLRQKEIKEASPKEISALTIKSKFWIMPLDCYKSL